MNIKWNNWLNDDETGVKNSLDELVGEKLVSVGGLEKGSEEVTFVTESGKAIMLYHSQNCCESVDLADFESDVEDFFGAMVISAEEVSREEKDIEWGSQTWTFYKIETDKGGLWMRWIGESNGYYSEDVDIAGGRVIN